MHASRRSAGRPRRDGSGRRVIWRAVARILIVGGGCRGRLLAAQLIGDGNVVRITTRTEASRSAIEACGAECWIGTPDRLATLRGALEAVTVACWLLASADGPSPELRALHGPRLEAFLRMAIDTTVRGLLYESAAAGTAREDLLAGELMVRRQAERNRLPAAFLTADPLDTGAWLTAAGAAAESLLGGR